MRPRPTLVGAAHRVAVADRPVVGDDIIISRLVLAAVITAERSFVTELILVVKKMVPCHGL